MRGDRCCRLLRHNYPSCLSVTDARVKERSLDDFIEKFIKQGGPHSFREIILHFLEVVMMRKVRIHQLDHKWHPKGFIWTEELLKLEYQLKKAEANVTTSAFTRLRRL